MSYQRLLDKSSKSEKQVSLVDVNQVDLSCLARLQIFDISTDFEPVFAEHIPKAFRPKNMRQFVVKTEQHKFRECFTQLPVFHPETPWLLFWQFCMTLIIFFYLFYIPFKIAYTDIGIGANPDDVTAIFFFVRFSIIVLTIDLMVSFNTGFHQYGILVLKRTLIAKEYLKWAFELDLMGVLSLFLALILSNDYIRLMFYFRFYYVLRFSDKIDYVLQLHEVMKACFRIFKLLIMVLLIAHTMACLFYGVASVELEDGKPSWLEYNDYVVDEDQDEIASSLWKKYTVSFYWALTTISTVGYGDITPKNDAEIGITLITMVLAGMVFAFNVASIREVIIEMNESNTKFKQYQTVINRYMSEKNISTPTQERVLEYLEYMWQEEKHRDRSIENQLISYLAPELKEQLFYESYSIFLFQPIFTNQNFSEPFLRSLSLEMKEEHFGPNEGIVSDDIQLYYLNKGSGLIYLPRPGRSFDDEIKIEYLSIGSTFGAVPFMTGDPYEFSIKSLSYSSLFKISRQTFLAKLKDYEEDFERYHLLLAKKYTSRFYDRIAMRCLNCGKIGHYCTFCPVTHYIPDKVTLVRYVQTREDLNERDKHQRKQRVKTKAITIQHTHAELIHEVLLRIKKMGRRITRAVSVMEASYLNEVYEESDDDVDDDHFEDELFDIKTMLKAIMLKLNIHEQEQVIQMPKQRAFLPEKPVYEPTEIAFDIDKIINYEIFQPEYNFSALQFRLQ